jgi:hypothetical protein
MNVSVDVEENVSVDDCSRITGRRMSKGRKLLD